MVPDEQLRPHSDRADVVPPASGTHGGDGSSGWPGVASRGELP
jgi:hypothetical protein